MKYLSGRSSGLLTGTVLLSLAMACAAPAVPQSPAAAERLLAEVPENWFQGVNKQVGELTIEEYFPPDTTHYWSQKLVFESLTSTNLPDPLVYVKGLAEQQADRCEPFQHQSVYAGFENGYPTVVEILQCTQAKLTGKPVVTMVKAIKGNNALYTISRIWRLENQPETAGVAPDHAANADSPGEGLMPASTLAEFAAWSNTLKRIQVCHDGLAAHPCPAN